MAGWVYVSLESVRILSPCFKPSLPCDAGIVSPSRVVVATFPSRYLYRCCVLTLLQSRIYLFWSLCFDDFHDLAVESLPS